MFGCFFYVDFQRLQNEKQAVMDENQAVMGENQAVMDENQALREENQALRESNARGASVFGNQMWEGPKDNCLANAFHQYNLD
ncbi:hypothetical protein DPEC_G00034600 [Dallia pectoralis]|uniref:Uncharacterized protein n=1 Tax=Dallia pectoralis TaxID=75939 RepID=A0ACC2HDG7_DALPE|nr:hypothetical protein DPEC_G00034600 [Dallia pectoralis]